MITLLQMEEEIKNFLDKNGNKEVVSVGSYCDRPDSGLVIHLKEISVRYSKSKDVIRVKDLEENIDPEYLAAYEYGKEQRKKFQETGKVTKDMIGFHFLGQFVIDISTDPTGCYSLSPKRAKTYYGSGNVKAFTKQYEERMKKNEL